MTVRLNVDFNGPLVEGVPEGYRLDNLVRDLDHNIFYALGSVGAEDCLYIGPKEELKEAEVMGRTPWGCGGSIAVHFELRGTKGLLVFPARYRSELATVSYGGIPSVELERIV